MSEKDAKRYYWLKLKEDFFEEDTMQWLEEQENGKEYSLIYLKLCLKSLKTDGLLVRNVGEYLIPYDVKGIAKITNSNVDTVVVAMELFKGIGLIEKLESGEIFMTQLEEMVGNETHAARRKRLQRAKAENDNKLLGHCPTDVPQSIELEKEKELDTESSEEPSDSVEQPKLVKKVCKTNVYKEITDYLNDKAGRSFSYKNKSTQSQINGRMSEGRTVDDFKAVIDLKVAQWGNDDKMKTYLRPATLFAPTNFENYINEALTTASKKKSNLPSDAPSMKSFDLDEF